MGLEWNVFALLAAFEWISAGFALWHLDPMGPWRIVAYLWNVAGVLLLATWATHLSIQQFGITCISLLLATGVQMQRQRYVLQLSRALGCFGAGGVDAGGGGQTPAAGWARSGPDSE
jgi:hypothetical protein